MQCKRTEHKIERPFRKDEVLHCGAAVFDIAAAVPARGFIQHFCRDIHAEHRMRAVRRGVSAVPAVPAAKIQYPFV